MIGHLLTSQLEADLLKEFLPVFLSRHLSPESYWGERWRPNSSILKKKNVYKQKKKKRIFDNNIILIRKYKQ